MKVVQVTEYGGPEVMQVRDLPEPKPGPGQVLVKVLASGVNPIDVWFRSGHFAERFKIELPYVPGTDIVGTVTDAGDGVGPFAVGQTVLGVLTVPGFGGYAEYVAIETARLALVPEGLDLVKAAAILTPGITGLQMLDKVMASGNVRRVLVLGALGGVGRSIVAGALSRGIEVTALVLPGFEDEARGLGLSSVETSPDPARIAAFDRAFDVIFDTIGPNVVSPWEPALAPGGTVISVVPLPPAPFTRTDVTFQPFAFSPDAASIAAIAQLAVSGRLTTVPIEAVPLDQAAAIHSQVLGGASGRKFVLVP